MRTSLTSFLTLVLSLGVMTTAAVSAGSGEKNSPLRYEMKDIDGNTVDLASCKGQVVMVVNTASKCGLTPQYEALQALYEKHREKGFVILAFPANNFGSQEPGTDSEIKEFCSLNFNVTFPLFSKISVKGEDIHPLYEYLTSEETNPGFAGEIAWNFTKFLLDREGRVIGRFEPRTTPDDPAVLQKIERALAGE